MIELDNRTSMQIEIEPLSKIAESLTNREIELLIISNNEIKQINKDHRGIDSPTDVLSFPYNDTPMSPLGSIVISCDLAEEKASEYGHSNMDEVSLLFIHGLLHLLGFDHELDNGEMRTEEARLIKEFNLPDSLIVRTQG